MEKVKVVVLKKDGFEFAIWKETVNDFDFFS